MARIALPDPESMTVDERTQYDSFPSNLARALVCASPDLASHVLGIGGAFRKSRLDPKLRELVILRVAKLSSSAYERMQHLDIAKEVGWSDEEIAAIEKGDVSVIDERARAVLGFTDECFENFRVSDTTFESTRAVLSQPEIATLVLLIGQYVLTAIFVETLDIDLDSHATSWKALIS
jgi:alkylhydroperoxidase family enzyme